MNKLLKIAGLALMLSGCDVQVGMGDKGERPGGAAAASPAAGKAQDGSLSIKAPGFDVEVSLPKGITDRAGAESDSELVYPGATIGGLHIEAGAAKAGRQSGVELRFRSADPVDKIVAWYRDPSRKDGFSLASEERSGGSFILSGTQKQDGDPFRLQLDAAPGGGTEGRLTLSDRN